MRHLILISFFLSLFLLSASCADPPPPPEPPPLDTWEYKCVNLRDKAFKDLGGSYPAQVEVVGNLLGPYGWQIALGSHISDYVCFMRIERDDSMRVVRDDEDE